MATATIERVLANLGEIEAWQIGKCTKVLDNDSKAFYLVENEAGDTDDDGNIIEYEVRYSKEHGFTCTCKSGQNGFANVGHPSGVDKHVRWAVAAGKEEKAALAAMAALIDAEKQQKLQHPLALPAVRIEEKWGIPRWILEGPVDPKMRKSPREE